MKTLFFYIDILFACVLAGVLFLRTAYLFKSIASRKWVMTQGKILSSQVISSRKFLKQPKYLASFIPKIVYEYFVGDRTYSSDRFSFSPSALFYKTVSNIVNKHPVGKIVNVYYNPKNPKDAVLVQGQIARALVIFFFTTLVLFYATWSLITRGYILPW